MRPAPPPARLELALFWFVPLGSLGSRGCPLFARCKTSLSSGIPLAPSLASCYVRLYMGAGGFIVPLPIRQTYALSVRFTVYRSAPCSLRRGISLPPAPLRGERCTQQVFHLSFLAEQKEKLSTMGELLIGYIARAYVLQSDTKSSPTQARLVWNNSLCLYLVGIQH